MFTKKSTLVATYRLRVTKSLDNSKALLIHDVADMPIHHSLNT